MYDTENEIFYIQNNDTIRDIKKMLLRAEWEKTSSKVCESTKPMLVCDLGQHRMGIDMAFDSHFGLIDYRYVLESSDYQIRRSYVDTVFQSGDSGSGLVLKGRAHAG